MRNKRPSWKLARLPPAHNQWKVRPFGTNILLFLQKYDCRFSTTRLPGLWTVTILRFQQYIPFINYVIAWHTKSGDRRFRTRVTSKEFQSCVHFVALKISSQLKYEKVRDRMLGKPFGKLTTVDYCTHRITSNRPVDPYSIAMKNHCRYA